MPTYPGFQPYEPDAGKYPVSQTSIVASQAVDVGDTIALSNAGTVDEMTVGSTGDTLKGVYVDTPISSSDEDYASIKEGRNYIRIINGPSQLWFANVESGTADQATDVGYEADLNSADGIDLDSSSNDDFVVTKVIDSSTVVGYFR